nr:carbonic anhydrase family protein [uncultured Bacteroides sp.]
MGEQENKSELSLEHILTGSIRSKEEQQKLTPNEVLDILKKGNQEFVEDNLTVRNNSDRIRTAVLGQYPLAVVLSCLDSRVPVEDIFHRGIGDVFVSRVAGNIVNEDILGSLEYACKVSGSKLIVVLGHTHCGAIQSAIDDVKMGNITSLLSKIKPAVEKANSFYKGDKSSKNDEFMDAVCCLNVQISIDEIRSKSPILKEMEDLNEIIIVGAIYDMKTGKVDFL